MKYLIVKYNMNWFGLFLIGISFFVTASCGAINKQVENLTQANNPPGNSVSTGNVINQSSEVDAFLQKIELARDFMQGVNTSYIKDDYLTGFYVNQTIFSTSDNWQTVKKETNEKSQIIFSTTRYYKDYTYSNTSPGAPYTREWRQERIGNTLSGIIDEYCIESCKEDGQKSQVQTTYKYYKIAGNYHELFLTLTLDNYLDSDISSGKGTFSGNGYHAEYTFNTTPNSPPKSLTLQIFDSTNKLVATRLLTLNQTNNEPSLGNIIDDLQTNMVSISAGSFLMGSEYYSDSKPVHSVQLKAFKIGKYEVTQEEYQAIMGSNPSKFKGSNLPVENVKWSEAIEFCKKISEKTGKKYSLPTEAQWEYACRSGSADEYPDSLINYSWYSDNANETTHPVGQKLPNNWGLYDVYGNAAEWCLDDWHSDYSGAPVDGSSWASEYPSGYHVIRGGDFESFPSSKYRDLDSDSSSYLKVGFRLVCNQ